MTQYKIYISEPAEKDLIDIIRYIKSQLSAPISAFNLMSLFEETMMGLSSLPQRHPLVTDERLAGMGFRILPLKNYLIFYSIDEKEKLVDIERILYGRRDWQRLL